MGRPKLTEEQKEANKARRLALKMQLQQTAQVPPEPVGTKGEPTDGKLDTPYGKITQEEMDQINKVHAIMAKADEARRKQYSAPKETAKPQGNTQLIHVAKSNEPQIDEEYVGSPQFVRNDEKGWEDV